MYFVGGGLLRLSDSRHLRSLLESRNNPIRIDLPAPAEGGSHPRKAAVLGDDEIGT